MFAEGVFSSRKKKNSFAADFFKANKNDKGLPYLFFVTRYEPVRGLFLLIEPYPINGHTDSKFLQICNHSEPIVFHLLIDNKIKWPLVGSCSRHFPFGRL